MKYNEGKLFTKNQAFRIQKGNAMEKSKKIVAIVGIVFLIGSYITTFVASLMHSSFAHGLFKASLFCSLVVPIILYGYILIYKYFSGKDHSDEE
ncbi:MAG: hypothetical protein Q4G58_11840 [bacterium]|nr:hypothetical protein [bacterium]